MFLILQHKSGGTNVYVNPRLIESASVSTINDKRTLRIKIYNGDTYMYSGEEYDLDDFLWQLGDVDI